jgi:glucosamine--fructose-6-phosphate aminotransferase (isomerizing)
MEDREIAIIEKNQVRLFDALGRPVCREPLEVQWDSAAAEKNGFEHFMMKEFSKSRGLFGIP